MQDILACLTADTKTLSSESTAQASTITALKTQSEAVSKRISDIKAKIESAQAGGGGGGGGAAPAADAAPAAP